MLISFKDKGYDPNHVIVGPQIVRSKKLRLFTVFIGLSLLFIIYFLLFHPFLLLEYRGVAASYITHVRGSEHIHHGGMSNMTKLDLPVNLIEATVWLKNDMIPYKFAIYYAILAILILIANPLLCCSMIVLNACLPDKFLKIRRFIGEQVEVLQCWCGPEAMVIAS